MGQEAAAQAVRFDFETIMKQWDKLFNEYENTSAG
jgi:hypothetical protein